MRLLGAARLEVGVCRDDEPPAATPAVLVGRQLGGALEEFRGLRPSASRAGGLCRLFHRGRHVGIRLDRGEGKVVAALLD